MHFVVQIILKGAYIMSQKNAGKRGENKIFIASAPVPERVPARGQILKGYVSQKADTARKGATDTHPGYTKHLHK